MIGAAILLYIVVPVSLAVWLFTVIAFSHGGGSESIPHPLSPTRLFLSIAIPVYMAYRGHRKGSLNPSGIIAAMIVGFILTLINYCFIASMVAFFLCGSWATKYKLEEKSKFEKNAEKAARRNWVQVVCNGGVATQLTLFYYLDAGCVEKPVDFESHYMSSWWSLAILSSIACSAGDTLASELGPLFSKSNPVLITTLSTVPKGTNGGVSFAGLVSSLLGGFIVSLAYFLTLLVSLNEMQIAMAPPQWPILIVGSLSGFIGSLIDSVLGSTLQFSGQDITDGKIVEIPGKNIRPISGIPLLDNHSINLLSSLITSILMPRISLALWATFSV